MRAEQVTAGQTPRYDGRCRDRTDTPDDRPFVVRFKTPRTGQVVVDDLVRGRVVFENSELDDLVMLRADGSPTYHFGVIVDDHDMEITHVIRGDDHLNNTPRQINMLDALGWPHPDYAHLPMILGPDGSRMSKRHGAVNVLEYREQGYLPAAMLNYLVRLGWSHGDQEIFSVPEMIELFDLADINPSASRFDAEKLRWMNQQYIIHSPAAELVDGLREQLEREGLDIGNGPALEAVIELYRERAATLQEMAQSCWYLFRDFDAPDPKAAKKHLRPVIAGPLTDLRDRLSRLDDWSHAKIHDAIQAAADGAGLGFGKLGQPLRVALTGGAVSPPIDLTAELVGRQRSLARIDAALALIEQRRQAAEGPPEVS